MSEEQSNLTPNDAVSVAPENKEHSVSQKEQKRSNMRGRWRRPAANACKTCQAAENIGLCTPDPDSNVPENLGSVVSQECHQRRDRQEQRQQQRQQQPPIDLNERRDNREGGYNHRKNDFEKREFIKPQPLTLWQKIKKFFAFCFRGKTEQQPNTYRGDKKKFYRHNNHRRNNRFRK